MRIAVCRACRQSYMQSRSDQRFCSPECRERGRSLGVSGGVLTRDVILFREQVRRLARRGDVGYKLHFRELDVSFPLPGRSRRWGGGWRETPCYSLEPFEPPRVPIETRYGLFFVGPQGFSRQPDPPHDLILVTFPEDMSRVPLLAPGLAMLKQMDPRRRRYAVPQDPMGYPEPPPSAEPMTTSLPRGHHDDPDDGEE